MKTRTFGVLPEGIGTGKIAVITGATNCIGLVIATGYVKTPLVKGQVRDTAVARHMDEQEVIEHIILAAQPTKKFVTTKQVSDLALFLIRDEAASITGSILSNDGGWIAG